MPKIQIPSVFKSLAKPTRYKVYYGGRGGAKSWNIARALIIRAAQQPTRILCAREFQQSIQESVHKLLADQIGLLGLDELFTVQQKNITCDLTGSEFIFEGLRNNVTKVKSMEGIDICWCEEAETIPERSWDVLIPTIRKPDSEIWVSFNPNDEMDDTYQRFVLNPPSNAIVQKVTWRDNPYFPDELRAEMDDLKASNHKKYLHVWEGECASDYGDSIIQPEWVEAAIDSHIKLGFEARGVRCVGYDPADEGSDNQAYAVRHGSVILDCIQWPDGDLNDGIDKVFNYAFNNKIDDVCYDSIGVGAGVKVGLENRIAGRNIRVSPFTGSESPRDKNSTYEGDKKNKDMFRNLRAQYWWYLRDRFEKTYRAVEKGEYIDPDELISLSSTIDELSQLKSELCRVQRKRGTLNSLILLESKPEMLKRGAKSPNMADSLVMAFSNPPIMEEYQPIKIQKRKYR